MNSDYDTNKLTGIFGGTFDPVHKGHIDIARRLIQLKLVEQIIFVPALLPPHKSDNEISTAEHRLAMLKIASARQPNLFISEFELNRQSVSYTVESAAHFAEIFGDRMRIVIGADSLADLHTWHKADELVTNYHFIIYCRSGYHICKETMLFPHFGKSNAEKLYAGLVHDKEFTICSREIRESIQGGENVKEMLPKDVLEYIGVNNLYV